MPNEISDSFDSAAGLTHSPVAQRFTEPLSGECRKGKQIMKKLFLAAIAAASMNAESICGKTVTTAEGITMQIACIDYDALRKVGVPIPPGLSAVTQVYIDVENGLGAAGVLSGQERIEFARKQNDGVRRAILVFDGIDHQELPVVEIVSGSTGAIQTKRAK